MPPVDTEIPDDEILADADRRDQTDVHAEMANLGAGRRDFIGQVRKDGGAANLGKRRALRLPRRHIRHLFHRTRRRVLWQWLGRASHGNFSRRWRARPKLSTGGSPAPITAMTSSD